jgi:DNA-binding CsgD family transcriptional regulator/PAS domain-containing protein
MALVDLKRRSVVAESPEFSKLVGGPAVVGLGALVDDRDGLGPLLDLLRGGAIDAYQVRRDLDLGGGRRLWADCWLAVCEQGGRGHALWAMRPVDDEGRGHLTELVPMPMPLPSPLASPLPLPLPGPGVAPNLVVVGAFDADWCMERVSVDIEAVLGCPLSEALGSSLIHMVHPDDVAPFLNAAAHCLAEGAAVGVELRVEHRDGTWRAAHMVIAPMAPGYLRFGFAIAVQKADAAGPAFRVADLERALWRIAQEVEGSGVAAGFARLPDTAAVPGLEYLSGRQWEVMTKLLAGERAPAIARTLHISQSTVRNTLSDIFAKLHVHSQEELLRVLRPGTAPHPGARRGPKRGGLSR